MILNLMVKFNFKKNQKSLKGMEKLESRISLSLVFKN